MEELAEEHKELKFMKVNTDLFMSIARDYKIMTIPAFKIFEKGKIVKETTGFKTKEEFEKFLEQ